MTSNLTRNLVEENQRLKTELVAMMKLALRFACEIEDLRKRLDEQPQDR